MRCRTAADGKFAFSLCAVGLARANLSVRFKIFPSALTTVPPVQSVELSFALISG